MVEVNQRIPDRDEAELRLAVQGGEPYAASRVFDKRPTSRGALDPAPGSRSYGCARQCVKQNEKRRKSLDNADDVIHGNWPGPTILNSEEPCRLSLTANERLA